MAILNKNAPVARPTRELCVMACCFCKAKDFQAWLSEIAGEQIDEGGAKAFIVTASASSALSAKPSTTASLQHASHTSTTK